ncbi:hypothetical protein HPB50_011457 [Hyalomma asiaticum]|uniref:Uncharacterized protein n=1 Tax=Hyalomma asiaticum TaxID=266040 RepID=A0ACB7SML0_HYAAI|nr:hypothetical protein HPB50_011457 [Hyalomma asiaticum]
MKPSDGHSRRICKILKSEWWRQVRTFKDLLRIACANGMDGHPGYRQYRQWCNVADSTSEFLWRTVRPTLPEQKKGNPVQGHVLNLSTTPTPEEHDRVLGLGPKYCFEPHLNPFEKIATARAVSRCAKEDERSRRKLAKPGNLRPQEKDPRAQVRQTRTVDRIWMTTKLEMTSAAHNLIATKSPILAKRCYAGPPETDARRIATNLKGKEG